MWSFVLLTLEEVSMLLEICAGQYAVSGGIHFIEMGALAQTVLPSLWSHSHWLRASRKDVRTARSSKLLFLHDAGGFQGGAQKGGTSKRSKETATFLSRAGVEIGQHTKDVNC